MSVNRKKEWKTKNHEILILEYYTEILNQFFLYDYHYILFLLRCRIKINWKQFLRLEFEVKFEDYTTVM